jgi:rSAM/selenodomain-associated transferase 2
VPRERWSRDETRPLTLSVIVPVWNEERVLPACLRHLTALAGVGEIIVVDGGSRDASAAIARAATGVRVLEAARGRARQMNAGAAAATGDVLLFLHADVALPGDAASRIDEVLQSPSVVGGAFRTWTTDVRGWKLGAPLLHLADLRSRYTRLPYGDQAMFVRADAFARVGGFPEQPLMEDVELSRRLRRIGRLRTVPARVLVSGRRLQSRPIYYTLVWNLLPLLYRLGVSPKVLAAWYGDPR